MKRLIDIIFSLLALIMLSPLFLVIAFAVYISDFGPVFFRQRRVGLWGTEFEIYKFRSMVINAENLGGFATAKDDARITLTGKFLRQKSLDELPQLINVLVGDMSLVGPRPDVPAQRTLYTETEWIARCKVRPGITGLAQATLRSDATIEERKRLDLKYVLEASILFDLRIILLTIKQVFGKGGN